MAGSPLKGIEELYECCCSGFYEWITSAGAFGAPVVAEGQVCNAPIWYNDAEALTLVEDTFNPWEEEKSSWKLTRFSLGSSNKRLPHRPYKVFNLESDDDLVVVKCKVRPVVTIKRVSSDWRVPGNGAKLHHTWLCLPVFRYKDRHTQDYVLRDQRLDRGHHFYIPPGLAGPGLIEEGVAKFTEMQFIPERNLAPSKAFCTEENMFLPYGLNEEAFHALLGHVGLFFPKIEIGDSTRQWYEDFSLVVKEEVDKVLQS
jgi:hypothetical protein